MSVWERLTGRTRSPAPTTEQRYTLAEIGQMMSTARNAYTDVDLTEAQSAFQDVAFHAGANLVASLGSELPLEIFRGEGIGAQKVPIPGYLEDPAGDGYGREDWTYKLIVSWITRGNMNADILARRDGYITQAEIFHPDLPKPRVDPDTGVVEWFVRGERVPNMWHRRVYPFPGFVMGLSPVELHMTQLGLSITTTRFGKAWFDEGAVPATVLHNEERNISGPQARTVKERFMAGTRGKREPVVLDRGWKLEQVQIAPEESQFLQTQQFSRAESARIIGPGVAEILGYETGGNLTYSNRLDRNADLMTMTMDFWLRRVERVYRQMLPAGLIPRFNRDAILDTLKKDRYETYNLATGGVPWMKPSEVRPQEGLAPAPELDAPPEPTGPPESNAMRRIAQALRAGQLSRDEAFILLSLIEEGGTDVPAIG